MIPLSAPPKASSSKDVLSVSRSGARNVSPDPQRVKPIERPTLSQKPLTEITPSSPSPSLNTLQSSNTIYRLKNPPKKFEPLVRALESQRLQGVTRIASSQLGMVLKPAEYTTGEITSLKKYTSLAEAAGVVILGADQGNGNRWIALHPAFHGMSRKPENALPPTS
ncbi:hypothetical protein K474DRAFT_750736 [Panus rudis PR-1116 ss-1]|nr:hypothetical protein K474DRAFT_750736 [Panus rudis PR-1116 ss-1]